MVDLKETANALTTRFGEYIETANYIDPAMFKNYKVGSLAKPLKEEIKGLQSEIDKYISTASNPEYQIAIVGAIKAGKSTLINALLGYDLASVDVTPETATLTKIKASEKSYVKTSFYTNEDWAKIWSQANNPKKKGWAAAKGYGVDIVKMIQKLKKM